MAQFSIFKEDVVRPLAKLGLTHPFWNINLQTVLVTWLVIAILIILTIITRLLTKKNANNAFSFVMISFIKSFKDLIDQTLGHFNFRHFSFITSLFIFIVTCNLVSLIPEMPEPTNDIMTTLALGITSFLYIQISAIQNHGLIDYLKGYLKPFFVMLPLNIVSHLATIISISFRLFGNIFGGAVISHLWYNAIGYHWLTQIAGIVTGMNLLLTLFFVLFEGFIQAFVFAMLSLTYLSLEVRIDQPSNESLG